MIFGLSYIAWIVVIIMLFALVTLFSNKLKPALVFFILMAACCILPVMSFEEAFAGMDNSSVLLVGVLYIVIAGLKYAGALDWMVKNLMGQPKTYVGAILRLMVPVATLSSVMSNTTTTALFKGVVQRWSQVLHMKSSKLLIPLAYAATIGGLLTVIGTPPNMIIASMYTQKTGEMLNIFSPLPIAIACLVVDILVVVLLRRLLPEREGCEYVEGAEFCDEKGQSIRVTDVPKWKTYASLIVMVTMLVVSAFNIPAFPLSSCALVAALTMMALGCCRPHQALQEVDWEVMIVFAGSVCLGTAISTVGLDKLIVNHLVDLCHGQPIIVLVVMALVSATMTEMISDTACGALFFPIAWNAAETMNVSPLPYLIVLMMSVSSSFCTPIATPPNLIVYNDGGYHFSDYARIGVPMKLCHLATAILLSLLVYPL